MNVAIAHHHLRQGGVSSVIEGACTALHKHTEIAPSVIVGEPPPAGCDLPVSVIDGLSYRTDPGSPDAVELATALCAAAPEADLWQFHNHSLGKNRYLPDAIARLGEGGVPLLLQLHDFAEDNRPSNYRIASAAEFLYPPAHYATVNTRDSALLAAAGLAAERAHFLPNPVHIDPTPPPSPDNERRLVFYPARGIRRKNLGEVALLAAVTDASAFFATSAAPANPIWRPIFDDWVTFCDELKLPVAFGVTDKASPADFGICGVGSSDFSDWYAAADAIVTTSAAEGFGLAFLESAARGRPLFGRNLPEVTGDFFDRGLSFSGLYSALTIPLPWVGSARLQAARSSGIAALLAVYGRDNEEVTAAALPDRVDFADLDEAMQRDVIRHVVEDPPCAAEIRVQTGTLTSDLPTWLDNRFPGHPEEVAHNRKTIATHYSLARYAERLTNIYRAVLDDRPASVELDREKILDAFLSPERFRFLLST